MANRTLRGLTARTAPAMADLLVTQDASSGEAGKSTLGQALRQMSLVLPNEGPVMSVSSGGATTLTLAAITGVMSFTDLFGSSGTWYNIPYLVTDGVPITQWEAGFGSLNLSSGVFTRTKVIATWSGTVVDVTSPSKLTIGTSNAFLFWHRWMGDPMDLGFYNQDNIKGIPSGHISLVTSANMTPVAATEYYVPYYLRVTGRITAAGLGCITGQTGGAGKMAIYHVGTDGMPGAKIADLASGTPFDLTANANVTVSVSGLWLPAGWYWIGMIFTATTTYPTLTVGSQAIIGPAAHGTASPQHSFTKAGTYASGMPDPASTSMSAVSNINSVPLPFLVTANT